MPTPPRNQERYNLAVKMRRDGSTFAEIGVALNVCKARACQMVAREIARIETQAKQTQEDQFEREIGKWAANVLRKNGLATKLQAKEALLSGRYLFRCGKNTRTVLWNWVQSESGQ